MPLTSSDAAMVSSESSKAIAVDRVPVNRIAARLQLRHNEHSGLQSEAVSESGL
jgi:hypothetical protein